MIIFTVTAIQHDRKGHRCFGYYPNLGAAVATVIDNKPRYDEAGYYDYIIIEEIRSPGQVVNETWFGWSDKLLAWVECVKPLFSVGTTHWAIG